MISMADLLSRLVVYGVVAGVCLILAQSNVLAGEDKPPADAVS